MPGALQQNTSGLSCIFHVISLQVKPQEVLNVDLSCVG